MNIVIVAVAFLFFAVDAEVETVSGSRTSGALVDASAQHVVVRAADGEKTIAATDVMRVTFPGASTAEHAKIAAWIELVDGTRLTAAALTRTKDQFAWKSPFDAAGALDARDVRTIRFQEADEAVLDRFAEIASRKASGDQIVIRRGEQTIDSLSGIVRDITADAVQFEIDGEVKPVPMKRVFALVFYRPTGRELPATACVVVDALGMTLPAAALRVADGKLHLTTPAGLEIVRNLDDIARIDYAAAKTVYLGDLKPESVEWSPLVGGEPSEELIQLFRPRTDRALFGGPLLLPRDDAGRYSPAWPYAKGLAIHSRTKLVYRLPRSFRSLSAVAGIDSRVRPAGSVRLVIDGDGKELYAGTLSGKDAAVSLALDVQGVKRLTILVDFDDDLDVADHLNLCDARLVE
ncbi:MAG: NPCBM/NEW2 domain-containing protein [Pirellulales bacterium]